MVPKRKIMLLSNQLLFSFKILPICVRKMFSKKFCVKTTSFAIEKNFGKTCVIDIFLSDFQKLSTRQRTKYQGYIQLYRTTQQYVNYYSVSDVLLLAVSVPRCVYFVCQSIHLSLAIFIGEYNPFPFLKAHIIDYNHVERVEAELYNL